MRHHVIPVSPQPFGQCYITEKIRAKYNCFLEAGLCSREFQSEVLVILTEYSTVRTCWEEFVTGNFAQLVNIQS